MRRVAADYAPDRNRKRSGGGHGPRSCSAQASSAIRDGQGKMRSPSRTASAPSAMPQSSRDARYESPRFGQVVARIIPPDRIPSISQLGASRAQRRHAHGSRTQDQQDQRRHAQGGRTESHRAQSRRAQDNSRARAGRAACRPARSDSRGRRAAACRICGKEGCADLPRRQHGSAADLPTKPRLRRKMKRSSRKRMR